MDERTDMKELVELAKALSDESRVRVVLLLSGGELCACRIIEVLKLAPSTVSAHMAVLHRAGLVKFRKQGTWRHYRLAGKDSSPLARELLAAVRKSLGNNPRAVSDRLRLKAVEAPSRACAGGGSRRRARP